MEHDPKIARVIEFNDIYSNYGKIGLTNICNSCYINSALQTILNNTVFVSYFLLKDKVYKNRIDYPEVESWEDAPEGEFFTLTTGEKAQKAVPIYLFIKDLEQNNGKGKTSSKKDLLFAWVNLIRQLWNTKPQGTVFNPRVFYGRIAKVAVEGKIQLRISGVQNDVQEFVIFLMDSLHDILSKKVQMSINGLDSILSRKDNMTKISMEKWIERYQSDYSLMVDSFFGQVLTRTICRNCNSYSDVYNPTCHYSLPIPSNMKKISIYDCFKLYLDGVDLNKDEHHWNCEKCQSAQDAFKLETLWRMPDMLIVQLKRFMYGNTGGDRVNTMVTFPLTNLDLTPYCSGYKKNEAVYNLTGVTNHIGGVGGGHYTAYCLKPNGKWYEFNDTHISEVSADKIASPMSYLLFYQKVKYPVSASRFKVSHVQLPQRQQQQQAYEA